MRPQKQVTKAEIEEQKERQRAIDARPIKKVAEAKARKKQRISRALERAKAKAGKVFRVVGVYFRIRFVGSCSKRMPNKSDGVHDKQFIPRALTLNLDDQSAQRLPVQQAILGSSVKRPRSNVLGQTSS
eukprot:7153493-Pyramimonas_sp.AAC.3